MGLPPPHSNNSGSILGDFVIGYSAFTEDTIPAGKPVPKYIQYNLHCPNPFGQDQKSLGSDKQKSSDN